jgi:hypothetical protein
MLLHVVLAEQSPLSSNTANDVAMATSQTAISATLMFMASLFGKSAEDVDGVPRYVSPIIWL